MFGAGFVLGFCCFVLIRSCTTITLREKIMQRVFGWRQARWHLLPSHIVLLCSFLFRVVIGGTLEAPSSPVETLFMSCSSGCCDVPGSPPVEWKAVAPAEWRGAAVKCYDTDCNRPSKIQIMLIRPVVSLPVTFTFIKTKTWVTFKSFKMLFPLFQSMC